MLATNRQDIYAEASTLGFAPGFWPDTFVYRDRTWRKTTIARKPGGDIIEVYYSSNGVTLVVINS